MEADWEVEIGGGAPVIEAHWPGFVDLRSDPQRARQLTETADQPALAEALIRLNAPASPVWTSKCDIWPILEPDAFDPLELDAAPDHAAHALGSYIDLLPRKSPQCATTERALAACRRTCAVLHAYPLRACRLDLILRRALLAPDQMGLGITAYLTACGASPAEAARTLSAALAALACAFCADATLQ
jgi:hypothetical protein